jgi:putative glutamine amidotransferase
MVVASPAVAAAEATGGPVAPDNDRAQEVRDVAAMIVERTDGVLLLGGPDVDPALWGAEQHPMTYGVHRGDDDFEIALIHAAHRAGKPMLGICRGVQVINVAFGGSLHQHLSADEMPGLLAHHPASWPKPLAGEHGPLLEVPVEAGSRIAEACGALTVVGAHSHHQGVDVVGTGLRVTGRTTDGVVGVLEHDDGWLVGVQWHPEDTAAVDPAQQRLFDAFVTQAALARAGGMGTHQ